MRCAASPAPSAKQSSWAGFIDLTSPSSTCGSADGGLGTEIAAQLGGLGRPGILYATGNVSHVMLTAADGDACIAKPYRPSDLLRALDIVSGIVAGRGPSPPFPRGFQVLRPSSEGRMEANG